MVAKHVMGFVLVFFLVVLVNPERSDEKILQNILLSAIIYAWFLMTTRCPFPIALVSLLLLLGIYLLNIKRDRATQEKQHAEVVQITKIQRWVVSATVGMSLIGFALYTIEKKLEYGNKFDFFTFLLGTTSCRAFTPDSAKLLVTR